MNRSLNDLSIDIRVDYRISKTHWERRVYFEPLIWWSTKSSKPPRRRRYTPVARWETVNQVNQVRRDNEKVNQVNQVRGDNREKNHPGSFVRRDMIFWPPRSVGFHHFPSDFPAAPSVETMYYSNVLFHCVEFSFYDGIADFFYCLWAILAWYYCSKGSR